MCADFAKLTPEVCIAAGLRERSFFIFFSPGFAKYAQKIEMRKIPDLTAKMYS